jgi:hypothetical protein
MAPIRKPIKNEVLQSWIDAILEEASDELNDWEIDFIHNVAVRVAHKQELSIRQEEILEKIYAEKTK